MHCTNCGTALSSGTSFCANCGTPVAAAASPVPASNYNYAQPAPSQTEGLAIASLVVSLATLIFTAGVFSFVGAILGHIALSNMKKNGKGGRGLAIAGIAVGWGITAILVIFLVIGIAVAAGTWNYYSN